MVNPHQLIDPEPDHDSTEDKERSSKQERSRQEKIWSALAEASRDIVATYGIVVLVLWLLQLVVGEQVAFSGMVKSTIQLLLIPAVLLLLLCLLLRQWRLALFLVPAVGVFFIAYGGFFVPRGGAVDADMTEVRVMTFNVQVPDENHVASLIEIIRASDADVVAVQELSPAAAAQFSSELGELYPYQALHVTETYVNAGQGVLSRYPIVDDAYWRYEQDHDALGHQRVALDIQGVEVVLYNTHPMPPYSSAGFNAEQHSHALRDVLQRADREVAPTILLGDFNMTDQFHEYRRITDHYVDAYRAVGDISFGFTYPHDKWTRVPPLVRLDYVFYSRAWIGLAADVWPTSGSSDHAPLIAELAIPAERMSSRGLLGEGAIGGAAHGEGDRDALVTGD